MTKDELRQKCIEAMAAAMIRDMFADHELPICDELWYRYLQTAERAFDALHGLVRVVPIEATEEMKEAGRISVTRDSEIIGIAGKYKAMAAAGDLTRLR